MDNSLQKKFDKSTKNRKEKIDQLISLVKELRDPNNGCPWDIEQTHKSLIPYVLEEAHEVADAIKHGNKKELCEELGDLLLQIILHSQIATEEKKFCFEDVVNAISEKIIRRHPHVFSSRKKLNIEEVKESWEAIKANEKASEESKSPITNQLLRKVRSQPSLSGAMLISKKVAKEGFEWSNIKAVIEKVEEEMQELKSAIEGNDTKNIQSELGDVFFTLVNIARWYDLNPEECIEETNSRFLERFSLVEKNIDGEVSNQSWLKLQKEWRSAKKMLTKKEKE